MHMCSNGKSFLVILIESFFGRVQLQPTTKTGFDCAQPINVFIYVPKSNRFSLSKNVYSRQFDEHMS